MTSRSNHKAKIAALQAYANDRLSARAKAQVEKHLDDCDICIESLIDIETYRATQDEIRISKTPAIDWQKVEDNILSEVGTRHSQNGRGKRRLIYALAPLAAAAFLYFQFNRQAKNRPSSPLVNNDPIEQIDSPDKLATNSAVTAILGSCTIDGIDAQIGDAIDIKKEISCTTGELHGEIKEAGSGFVVHANSLAQLIAQNVKGTSIELLRGELSNSVRTGEAYAVLADDYRVEVRGTRFRVGLDSGNVAVELSEGAVAIVSDDDEKMLNAPARWSSSDSKIEAAATPRFGNDGQTLDFTFEVDADQFRIDGFSFAGDLKRAQLFTATDRVKVGILRDGTWEEKEILVLPEGNRLDESLFPPRKKAPEGLSKKDVLSHLRSQPKSLQRCVSAALKHNPALKLGSVKLSLRIAPSGKVRKASISGVPTTPLRVCLENRISQMNFKTAPNGSNIVVPLRLSK